jgi:chromosome segregation ATPase
MHLYLDTKVDTGVKINWNRKKEILELKENLRYWDQKITKFESEIVENNETIRSLLDDLENEKKLYKIHEDYNRRSNIRKIENKIRRFHKKNQEAQDKIKKYDTKIRNGQIRLEKYYMIFCLEYYIKLHQRLWKIRMNCLKSGKLDSAKISGILREVNTNPMFRSIDEYLSILDQKGLDDYFQLSKFEKITMGSKRYK